jgi:uncharacterized protein YndB with AHSA1/START domain
MIDKNLGFTLVRNFDATPAEIWRAWTDPDEAAMWWHPRGVSTPRDSVVIDARVGGRYTYTMINDASGEEYPTLGVYLEVVENERLVFTWGNPGEADDDALLITVTIEDLGELSRMTFYLRGIEGVSGDDNIYDGWEQALDALAAGLR